MQKPKVLQELLESQMDRKEFLKYASAGLLLVSGGGMIVNALGLSKKSSDGASHGDTLNASSAYGYGSSAYGGKSA